MVPDFATVEAARGLVECIEGSDPTPRPWGLSSVLVIQEIVDLATRIAADVSMLEGVTVDLMESEPDHLRAMGEAFY